MPEIGIKLYDNSLQSIGKIKKFKELGTLITTIVDNQELAEIEIFRIEDNRKDYFEIGRIRVNKIPRAKAGEPRIKLTISFNSSEDMVISVFLNDKFKNKIQVPSSNWNQKDSSDYDEGKDEEREDIHLDFVNETTTKGNFFVTNEVTEEEEEEREPEIVGAKKSRLRWLIIPLIIIVIAIIIFAAVKILPTPDSGSRTPVAKATKKPTEKPTQAPTPEKTADPTQVPTTVPAIEKALPDIADINSQVALILPIYFMADSSSILPEYTAQIDKLADLISPFKGQIMLEITGHSAKSGTQTGQMNVSRSRAVWLRDELVKRGVTSAGDCEITAMGNTRPVYKGTDRTQFYLNRRIEVKVRL